MEKQDFDIETFIMDAVLAGRLHPGARLGEAPLAKLFGTSRTKVREALVKLQTRGIVTVSPRRGWFVAQPSAEEARDAFHARKIVETGLLLSAPGVPETALAALRTHLAAEQRSLESDEIGTRTCLLGDFHIILANLIGNGLVSDIIRDLTARTTLISMLYQPKDKAEQSSHDHEEILAALEDGDLTAAAALMSAHIDHVENGLNLSATPDPMSGLREAFSTFTASAPRPDSPPGIPSPLDKETSGP
ncbi:GntR family transcriptional regulator [Rhodospirillum sp. A1_3_36]|uniref:GntR family transcriptional regulator n=1 Tax=Rhodospirillum sp. A1_3_36 TaxID=3391666 RepID=UPI0039A5E8F9